MECPYCRAEVDKAATKCRYCHEFIVRSPTVESASPSYGRLQLSADLAKAISWPVCALLILVFFREDLSSLFHRMKSLEVAGTKSEFADYAAAFGFMKERVGTLAAESDPETRKAIEAEIIDTATRLRGLHPLSLSFLVDIGRGVRQDDAWPENAEYVFELHTRGLVSLAPKPVRPSDISKTTKAELTESGHKFLDSIGYGEHMRAR